MSERPWYKRYGADFVHGTLGMTLEEKGAYSIVLDLIYDRQGPIPDDPRYIAGACGCSVRKWNTIRERLIDLGKIFIIDDMISNSRAEKELENSAKTSRKLAESGRKGGEKSGEIRRINKENNDLAEAILENNRSIARVPEARGQKPESPPKPPKGENYSAEFEKAWKLYPNRQGGNPKRTAWQRWKQRLRDGYTAEQMTEGIRRYAAHIRATDREGTPYVKQASSFLGKEDPPHFMADWGGAITAMRQGLSDEEWRFYMRTYEDIGPDGWPQGKCGGPHPGACPAHIRREFGYGNDLFDERKRA